MDQRQRPLSLVQIAEDLLAVRAFIADQIQQIVPDLEGRAEVKPEPHQGNQLGLTP